MSYVLKVAADPLVLVLETVVNVHLSFAEQRCFVRKFDFVSPFGVVCLVVVEALLHVPCDADFVFTWPFWMRDDVDELCLSDCFA